jgi:hypothetical protein
MSKKYFIFISASEDLKTERRELIKIVTELGSVPVTMDGFDLNVSDSVSDNANDSGQGSLRLIKKAIEESDYFINLTAHKCGPQAGKSFAMEMEFSWAERCNIPIISFIIDEKARWKATKKEKESSAIGSLESFKKRLKEHPYATWINTADLCQKATALLVQEMNFNPREGWVRANNAVDPCVANELARLLRENETLKYQISMESGNPASGLKERIKQDLKVLATNKIDLSFWYTTGDNWENTRKFRYLRLYRLLAPELSTAKTTAEISRFLGNILNPDLGKTVRKDFPVPTNTIKKIMADFSLLRLVSPVRGETKTGPPPTETMRPGKSPITGWKLSLLTGFGR